MAKRYLSIEKRVTFQGRGETWSNVYLYETPASTQAEFDQLIDNVLAAERTVHGTGVTFTLARIYTTEGLNDPLDRGGMLYTRDLSAVGLMLDSTNAPMYRECAVLVKWPLPRKSLLGQFLGRQRSLKKWIHTCASGPFGADNLRGISPIIGDIRGPYLNYATSVQTPIGGTELIAPDGTEPNGDPVIHQWLEHRQFPRGRKET